MPRSKIVTADEAMSALTLGCFFWWRWWWCFGTCWNMCLFWYPTCPKYIMINVYYIIYSVFVVGCVKTTKLIVALSGIFAHLFSCKLFEPWIAKGACNDMLDLNLGAEPQGTQHHQLLFASFVHRLPELIEWTITYTSATIHHEVLSQKQRSQKLLKTVLPTYPVVCSVSAMISFRPFNFFFEPHIALCFCQRFHGKNIMTVENW